MALQIARRKGTTAEHATFTGIEGELTVDTTKKTVVVHDGATAGGNPLATSAEVAGAIEEAFGALTAADVPTSDESTVQAKLTSYADTLSGHTTTLGTHTSQLAEKALQLHLTEKTSYGIVSGLGVTAHGTPDMAVAVALGVFYKSDGTRHPISAVASLPATPADATNPRIDIVYVSSADVVTYLAGTAGATPAAPVTPVGGTLLAEISVAANQTTVAAANIADRKKGLWLEAWIKPTFVNSWEPYDTSVVGYRKNQFNQVSFIGRIKSGTVGTTLFTLPSGYRPSGIRYFPAVTNGGVLTFIYVASDGTVVCASGNNGYLSLDTVRFEV